MVYINLCVCVYVCVSILWGVIYYFYIQLFWVCLCIIIYTHTQKICAAFYTKEEEREKIISGASSLVQDHQNETGALQMRYQCLWSTISPFPELVFLIVFPLLWTALKENSFPIFLGGDLFSFFPLCFQKIPVFFFFFLQTACIGTAHCRWSETISPLKKNSWWNYIKKNLQKSSRRLCPIMDCSTGERILIYIFLKN